MPRKGRSAAFMRSLRRKFNLGEFSTRSRNRKRFRKAFKARGKAKRRRASRSRAKARFRSSVGHFNPFHHPSQSRIPSAGRGSSSSSDKFTPQLPPDFSKIA